MEIASHLVKWLRPFRPAFLPSRMTDYLVWKVVCTTVVAADLSRSIYRDEHAHPLTAAASALPSSSLAVSFDRSLEDAGVKALYVAVYILACLTFKL